MNRNCPKDQMVMGRHNGVRRLSRTDALALAATCLLLVVLVPVLLARPRERASRVLCGANLGRIGKTMLIYANDYEGVLPRAGGPTTIWGPVSNWIAPNRWAAYAVNPSTQEGGTASFSSCFYLLVKYCQVPPRVFICKGDPGAREFRLSDVLPSVLSQTMTLSDFWDFGPTMSNAAKSCSYTYHVPFGQYGLTTARDPNLAVAADRNPWMSSPGADAKPFPGVGPDRFMPDVEPWGGSSATARNGNTFTHQNDGQNVLFLDGRVVFEKGPCCGVRQDNIYTVGDRGGGSPMGLAPVCSSQPQHQHDSLLLHDAPSALKRAAEPSGDADE
jgi:hypothetical protein